MRKILQSLILFGLLHGASWGAVRYTLAPSHHKEFQDISSLKKAFKMTYGKIHKESPNLFEYVRKYRSAAFFEDINNFMRLGEEGYREALRIARIPASRIEQRLDHANRMVFYLSMFFYRSKLNSTIEVYRMVSQDTMNKIKSSPKLIFKDDGLVSSSYTKEGALLYGQEPANRYHKTQLLKIILLPGVQVIDMENALSYTEWAGDDDFSEIVINGGYSYKVFPSDEEGVDVILEIIPPESSNNTTSSKESLIIGQAA